MIKLKLVHLGVLQTNCYIVYDDEDKTAVIIDAAEDNENKLDEIIKTEKLQLKAILLTHSHFDHIGAVDRLRATYKVKAYASEKEAMKMKTAEGTLGTAFNRNYQITAEIDSVIKDEELLEFNNIKIKCIEVPGHSIQGMCFYLEREGYLFSGDTIFYGTFGRTDLYEGSEDDLYSNICKKLYCLPKNTKVFPGHGLGTTIEASQKVMY